MDDQRAVVGSTVIYQWRIGFMTYWEKTMPLMLRLSAQVEERVKKKADVLASSGVDDTWHTHVFR